MRKCKKLAQNYAIQRENSGSHYVSIVPAEFSRGSALTQVYYGSCQSQHPFIH